MRRGALLCLLALVLGACGEDEPSKALLEDALIEQKDVSCVGLGLSVRTQTGYKVRFEESAEPEDRMTRRAMALEQAGLLREVRREVKPIPLTQRHAIYVYFEKTERGEEVAQERRQRSLFGGMEECLRFGSIEAKAVVEEAHPRSVGHDGRDLLTVPVIYRVDREPWADELKAAFPKVARSGHDVETTVVLMRDADGDWQLPQR